MYIYLKICYFFGILTYKLKLLKPKMYQIFSNLYKFFNESVFRNYVYKVLERVLHDIKNNGRFDSLQMEIDNIAKKQESERNLEANAQIWLSQAKELQELLESNKKANEEDRKNTIKLAQESDAQVDHAIFLNSGKLGKIHHFHTCKYFFIDIIVLRLCRKMGEGQTRTAGTQIASTKERYAGQIKRLLEGI